MLFIVFAVWFAASKIKLRDKLGGMSMVLGCAELIVGALHITMLAVGLVVLTMTVVNNPEIDEAAMDQLFGSKAKLAIVISGASSCVVSLITTLFFASVRARSGTRHLEVS